MEKFTNTVTGQGEVLKIELPDHTTLEDAKKVYREHFLKFDDEFLVELWRQEVSTVN